MSTAAGFGLERIGQIAVTVHDLERATSFYRDTLGMRHLFSAPSMAFFDCAGVRLMLGLPEGEGADHRASIIYYEVSDMAAAHAALVARGVEFLGAPHVVHRTTDQELWMTFLKDTEGNVLALMTEAREDGRD